jgi:hypothetical protein
VTPVSLAARITKRGFRARGKSIMLTGHPSRSEVFIGKALDVCPLI